MTRQARGRPREDARIRVPNPTVPSGTEVYAGGRFRPLSDRDVVLIIGKAFSIVETIGMSGTPDWLRECLEAAGAKTRSDGRVLFERGRVEQAINRAAKTVNFPGFREEMGIQIGGGNVHTGTAGAAVEMLDAQSGDFRKSTLSDLYDLIRVIDRCPNVYYGIRPVVARDMPSSFDLDINTAYACLRGTTKPMGMSFDSASHVAPVTQLFDMALGREGGFRKQPFCLVILVHVVPPLGYALEGVEIMREAIAAGMPMQLLSFGQAGATSPASLAGALAQGLAEIFAGLMVVDALSPGHPCMFGLMPVISDLRTGAMSGGGGECAIANAAAAQLLLDLGLPSTVAAGMTDSKAIDAQAGYEKAYTVALAAQAGADMINLSVGMLGSIMAASSEALVIDDEMCGAILRSVRGIEVRDDSIDLDAIERVVTGDGHYLGESQTLNLMKTEDVYPRLADRLSVSEWVGAGSKSIWEKACEQVSSILAADPPDHLPPSADQKIRERFDIRLNI